MVFAYLCIHQEWQVPLHSVRADERRVRNRDSMHTTVHVFSFRVQRDLLPPLFHGRWPCDPRGATIFQFHCRYWYSPELKINLRTVLIISKPTWLPSPVLLNPKMCQNCRDSKQSNKMINNNGPSRQWALKVDI